MSVVGWFLVLLSAGLQVAGTLMLRNGLERAGGLALDVAELPQSLMRLASQPIFDIGFILYGLAALVWFRVLSTQPLSLAYPILVSLTFLFVTLGATVLFQEALSVRKLLGLGVILVGILIVGGD